MEKRPGQRTMVRVVSVFLWWERAWWTKLDKIENMNGSGRMINNSNEVGTEDKML